MSLEKYLKKQAVTINKSLTKIVPRKLSQKALLKITSPVRYTLDYKALTKGISDPVWDFLDRGGKRWRPVLFLAIVDLLGKDPKKFIDFACIFELIHNGALIVDDLEDSSLLRRGKKTLHLIYGVDIAVNAGNALYYLPLKIFEDYKDRLSEKDLLRLYRVYINECVNLHLGQATDIVWHKGLVDDFTITEKHYLQMCAFKTGGLARMASKMAAVVAGADEKLVEAFGRLGESLGIIFQIQDDILNITESELSQKKGLGEDITEGKRSLPVIYALHNLPKAKAKSLLKILLMHTPDGKLIKQALDLIAGGKGIEKSRKTMEKLFQESWDELSLLIPQGEKKDQLYSLARFLVDRQV